jgi:glycine dehydrogenase subunit 2
MKLIFDKSVPGLSCSLLPPCDVESTELPEEMKRKDPPALPELSETDVSRHYSELSHHAYGVNCGFYPLGSCTMKYNPRIDEEMAALKGFTGVHPLAPADTVKGCREVLDTAGKYLCEITGMSDMTFQPAAGAHGEFTGVLLIKQYHDSRGDSKRKKIIVPDSAHGTNPATAAMCGFEVVNVSSDADGCVDLEALKAVLGEDTAGLMLTNPNTLGLFDENILEITRLVHEAGGLCYYDGANLNAVMGVVRPGDMGFDCIHLNLHKTFATPHGGGGPGAGAVGCKHFLKEFLPESALLGSMEKGDGMAASYASAVLPAQGEPFAEPEPSPDNAEGIPFQVRSFSGNFLVVVRALTYMMTLGKEGIPEAARSAVLNANYLMRKIKGTFEPAYDRICMHEFVLDLSEFKKETGISALDAAKTLIDYGMHPPTMYFPLIVHEALMLEPTETEGKEMLDWAAGVFRDVWQRAHENPDELHSSPHGTQIGRPDEVQAARNPVLRWQKA